MPKVSIFVTTYNHEKYISECFDSIINQNTKYSYEIVVGVDKSKDNTESIVKYYEHKYPQIIIAKYFSENVGGFNNLISTLSRCKGEYLVYLDGDDRILPGKIEAQTEFMDMHPSFSMCGHNIRVFDNSTQNTIRTFNENIKIFNGSIDDLAQHGTYIGSASVMYRSKYVDIELYKNLYNYKYQGDLLLHMIVARNGPIGYIDKVYSEYRKHDDNLTKSYSIDGDKYEEYVTEHLDILSKANTLGASIDAIKKGKASVLYTAAEIMLLNKRYQKFKEYFIKATKHSVPKLKQHIFYSKLINHPKILHRLLIANSYRKKLLNIN